MVKTLTQLRKERDNLLKKRAKSQSNAKRTMAARRSLQNLSNRRAAERKAVSAEIRALKNPKSAAAKKKMGVALRRFGRNVVKSLDAASENR